MLKTKCFLPAICLVFLTVNVSSVSAQGWVGNGGTNLTAVNSSLGTTPLSIGIGTSTPTAQLHTTGTLRFDNLTNANAQNRVLVTDATGNVFWRDASSIGTTNAWLLTGNAGTNAANFLGTTDAQSLSFRTNNTQRMTILANNGFVGIGVPNPQVRLHVSDNPGGMTGFPYETAVIERGGDTKLGVYCSNPNPVGATGGGASVALGYTNYLNNNNRYQGYEMQLGAISNSSYFLRFNSIERTNTGLVTTSLSNVMVMDNNGNVGINLGPATGTPNMPAARLHTVGQVRHQGLPAGAGNIIVIDANGDLRISSATSGRESSVDLQSLKKEIAALRKEIETLKGQQVATGKPATPETEKGMLFQNTPNPFSKNTSIRYAVPAGSQNIRIIVSSLQGVVLKDYEVINTAGYVEVEANELASGTYIYSLYSNGKLLDSKKMVLTH
ncbi:MAG: T9SS type A sorting domain-containing protein [Bacteroidetes bacterium]|nr:T9SS type A sorting domain-containing protein [Bacteroidota bacterium]